MGEIINLEECYQLGKCPRAYTWGNIKGINPLENFHENPGSILGAMGHWCVYVIRNANLLHVYKSFLMMLQVVS